MEHGRAHELDAEVFSRVVHVRVFSIGNKGFFRGDSTSTATCTRSVRRVALRPVGDLGTTDGVAVLGSVVFHSVRLLCSSPLFPLSVAVASDLWTPGSHVARVVVRRGSQRGSTQVLLNSTTAHKGRCRCSPCYRLSCACYFHTSSPPGSCRRGVSSIACSMRNFVRSLLRLDSWPVEAAGCTGTCLLIR